MRFTNGARGLLKKLRDTQIRYEKQDVDYLFEVKYKRFTEEATLKLQMDFDKDDRDFERRKKDTKTKQMNLCMEFKDC